MKTSLYDSFWYDLACGVFDFRADSFRVLLVHHYRFDPTHRNRADVANEVSAPGYSARDLEKTFLLRTPGKVSFHAQDVEWFAATFAATGAVLYKSRGRKTADDELVGHLDFSGEKKARNGVFTLSWDDAGVLILGDK